MTLLEFERNREIPFSFGVSKPGKIITNAEAAGWHLITRDGHPLSQPEQISQLLGGNQEREVRPGKYAPTALAMAQEAAEQALGHSPKNDLAAILATTSYPTFFDSRLPRENNLSLALKKRLGLPESVICKDIYAACSGGVFLLDKVRGLKEQLEDKKILIVATERYSGFLDDPFDKLIFSDKAVALLSRYGRDWQILESLIHYYGDPQGLLKFPIDPRFIDLYEFPLPLATDGKFQMAGHAVQRFTLKEPENLTQELLAKTHLSLTDIKLLIFHQANGKTIQAAQKKFGLPKVYAHYQKGNASAASIFLALKSVIEEGRIQKGDKVILAAFGGGLSSGACLMQFGSNSRN